MLEELETQTRTGGGDPSADAPGKAGWDEDRQERPRWSPAPGWLVREEGLEAEA